MFTQPHQRAIERSMPPPPLRKASVLAIPTMTNGAIVPSVGAIWLGRDEVGLRDDVGDQQSHRQPDRERRRPLT